MKRRPNLFLTFAAPLAMGALLLTGCNSDPAVESEVEEIAAPRPPAAEARTSSGEGGGLLTRMGLVEEPEPEPVVIPAGTRVRVRTTSTLSTRSNQAGESFIAHIAEPVMVDGRTIFPEGARVVGVVSLADRSGRVKGVARLGAKLSEIETTNGDEVAVDTKSYVVVADKTHGKDATKIGIGAGVGTGAVLATRGDPAVIPAESVIWFELASPVTVR